MHIPPIFVRACAADCRSEHSWVLNPDRCYYRERHNHALSTSQHQPHREWGFESLFLDTKFLSIWNPLRPKPTINDKSACLRQHVKRTVHHQTKLADYVYENFKDYINKLKSELTMTSASDPKADRTVPEDEDDEEEEEDDPNPDDTDDTRSKRASQITQAGDQPKSGRFSVSPTHRSRLSVGSNPSHASGSRASGSRASGSRAAGSPASVASGGGSQSQQARPQTKTSKSSTPSPARSSRSEAASRTPYPPPSSGRGSSAAEGDASTPQEEREACRTLQECYERCKERFMAEVTWEKILQVYSIIWDGFFIMGGGDDK